MFCYSSHLKQRRNGVFQNHLPAHAQTVLRDTSEQPKARTFVWWNGTSCCFFVSQRLVTRSKDQCVFCQFVEVKMLALAQTKQGCSMIAVLRLGQLSGLLVLGTIRLSQQRIKGHNGPVCSLATGMQRLAVPDEARLFYNNCASSGTALRSASFVLTGAWNPLDVPTKQRTPPRLCSNGLETFGCPRRSKVVL